MRKETKKAIAGAIIDILFIAVISAAALFVVSDWLDRKIARECVCGSQYSWCPSYWEDKNICRDGK